MSAPLDRFSSAPVDLGKLGWKFTGRVVEWSDGDTVVVDCLVDIGFEELVTKRRRIRLAGIDTPETRGVPDRAPGLAAKAHAETLAPAGSKVWVLVIKYDKYGGRDLGNVATGDGHGDIAESLVAAGHAKAYDGGPRT